MTAVQTIAGVELGGTKCVAVLARTTGDIERQVVVPTTDPDATLGELAAILADWWQHGGFDAIGIGSFGPLVLDGARPDHGRIAATSKPGWAGADVLGRLARPFAVPVAFDTDVNAAALAEGRWGAAQGLSDYAYVTVGTGVGVGLIVGGRPTGGFGHCELGHMRVARQRGDDWPGSCPFHGDCVEGLASGPAIAARLGGSGADAPPDHPVWDGVAHTLAELCQALVLAAAPHRILIGGGVAGGQAHLLPRIDRALRDSLAGYVTLPMVEGDYVQQPGLGDRAGPLGPVAMAAALLDAR